MNWWILLIIVLLLIILAPISVTVEVRNKEPYIRVDIRWLWGFLRCVLGRLEASIRIMGWKVLVRRPGEASNKVARPESGSSESGGGLRRLSRFLNRPFIHALFKTLGSLKAVVSINAWADLQLGFPDPARTGMIYGMLGSLCSTGMFPGLEVSPDFVTQKSSGILTVQIDTVTGRLIWVAVQFAFSGPVRSIWWPELNWEGVKRKCQKLISSTT